jgi:UDP-N-acetylmuramoyl-tripeptide--D-alanyl-D-alanine ligase
MSTLVFIIAGLWACRILINISSYIYLWYVKEYRPDRMIIHLKRTTQGKWIYFPKWKIPPLSIKTAVLASLLTGSEIALFLFLPYHIFIKLAIVDLVLFPLSFLFVALLRIPTLLYHRYKIHQAKNMLANHQWKSVIGITGSFGKTSTKEFLSTILSSKYSVLKTELSKNSAIGISETVLSQLQKSQEMFVVEMGAYKIGEIAEMSQLVHPSVGIITAINAQHQDLFGSIETTMKAKYELLAGLYGKRIAVVNADNGYSYTMGTWAKRDGCDIWFVTKDKKLHPEALCWIEDSVSNQTACTFTLHYKDQMKRMTIPIKGEHFVINIALAIVAAIAAGMTFNEAVRAAETIHSVNRVMQLSTGSQGELLINDTFNNNPDAAIAAIQYLNKFKKKKIVVFQPMIELGAYTDSGHDAVGKIAGIVCDEIILTNNNFSKAFIHGVQEADIHKNVHIFSPEKAASYIRSIVHKDDAILFKGKEAEYVWKLLQ